MIIDTYNLNQTDGGRDFLYNDKAEDALANAICYFFDLQSQGGTQGYDPRYDKLINNKKVEIKISSKPGLYIEYARSNNMPSGIFTSEADIYMTVNPGYDRGQAVMKVRLYKKRDLEHWVKQMLESCPHRAKHYQADNMGPGSRGFVLSKDAVNDLYIIGFPYQPGKHPRSIVFNTHIPSAIPTFGRRHIYQYFS